MHDDADYADGISPARRVLQRRGLIPTGYPVPRRSVVPMDGLEAPKLHWFPKRFLEGDLDGEGAEKMLGRSSTLNRVEILVRETAQNAWDARLPTAPEVVFELHLRRASSEERSLLAHRVFGGDPYQLKWALPALEEATSRSEPLWLLEIHDRGTKGLGGPVSSRVTPERGDVTDFRDFVLNIGSPRDQEHGGGTYGFGKTAAYKASRCDSILIWSCFRDRSGRRQTRLIGSAMGHSFDMGGTRYTGRHWWALPGADHGTFVPASESWAGELGDALYTRQFPEGSTGTSLMIVDPDMGELSPRAFAAQLASSALKHLWPKMHPEAGRPVMDIRVLLDGEQVPIPAPADHPVLRHFTAALDAVRAVQRGSGHAETTRVFPVTGMPRGVGQTTIGHLAVVPFPHADGAREFLGEESLSHVAFMRNRAELVVKYHTDRLHANDKVSWVGVFKPTLEHDDAFADAEPPAHDDWAPESVGDPSHKSVVRVAMRRIESSVKEWASPDVDIRRSTSSIRPAAVLADALASLLPGVSGSAVKRYKKASGSGSGVKRSAPPKAAVGRVVAADALDGATVWQLRVDLSSPDRGKYWVEPRLGVATVDKDDFDVDEVRILGWDQSEEPLSLDEPPQEETDQPIWMVAGEPWWIRVAAPAEYALSVDLKVTPFDEDEES